MSIIEICRSTLKSLLCGNTKRVVMTTVYGWTLIKNTFSHLELLEMEILGIYELSDVGVFSRPELNVHNFVFFIESHEDLSNVYTLLPLCNTSVYVHFYTPVSADVAARIKIFDVNDTIKEITTSAMSITPISDNVAVSDKASILSVMKFKPKKITTLSGQVSDPLLKRITDKVNGCAEVCSIHERIDPSSMLIGLERSYDTVTPLIIPWTYSSMLHFHKIKFENHSEHCNDDFFAANAYESYDDVIGNFEAFKTKAIEKNLVKNTKTKSVISALEIEQFNKIVLKHRKAINELSNLIENDNIFAKSKQEQQAITRSFTSEREKKEFVESRPVVSNAIYASKAQTIRTGTTSVPISIYCQNVPKITTLIEKYVGENPNISNIYFYVSDYICYEEVAEVEKFNKKSLRNKVYLLSDSILDYWSYLATTHKNIVCDKLFRINNIYKASEIIDSELNTSNEKKRQQLVSKIDLIQERVNKLTNYSLVFFNDEEENQYNIEVRQITNMLKSEHERLKLIVPANKIEENRKNMELLKLNKLTKKFKTFEMSRDFKNNTVTAPFYLDELDKFAEQNDRIKQRQIQQFDNENMYDIALTEQLISQRDQAIGNIAEGIFDINKLSLELLLVVQEQSMKLEKMEVELLNSVEFVKQGAEKLEEADEIHASSMGWQQKVTAGLGFIVAALVAGVAAKLA